MGGTAGFQACLRVRLHVILCGKLAWGGVRCTAGGGFAPDSPGAAVIASSGAAIGPVTHAAVVSAAGVVSVGGIVVYAIKLRAGICVTRNGHANILGTTWELVHGTNRHEIVARLGGNRSFRYN